MHNYSFHCMSYTYTDVNKKITEDVCTYCICAGFWKVYEYEIRCVFTNQLFIINTHRFQQAQSLHLFKLHVAVSHLASSYDLTLQFCTEKEHARPQTSYIFF